MWGIYVEGNPTWEMKNVSSPSLDGNSLQCSITGGDPYSNVHCYRNLPADPSSNLFTLSMSFYYQPSSTFNNEGGASIVQGLEFTMNKWDQGLRYEWALQWDNVDSGAPKWRYWDPTHSPKWVDLGISGPVTGEEWHTLTLEGDILDGKVHYHRFVFDQQEYQLNIPSVAPDSTPGDPDKLAVAVQIDGNSTETPYDLIIDHVTLESGVSTAITSESIAANDGWTLESSEYSSRANQRNNSGALLVGDDIKNKQYRSLLYFDTASLPDNALISNVTLKVKQAGITGTDPFTTHLALLADMAKGFFGKSPLENTDFQAKGAPRPVGSFTAVSGEPGWYQLVLNPSNFKYVNLNGVTQFRLRFSKDDNNDKGADIISFYSGEDAINPPQLIVEYITP
jgi:hypothetical protein